MARGARLAKREVGGRRSVRPPWARPPTTPTKLHLSWVGWGQCPWLQGSQPRPEAEGLEVCLPGAAQDGTQVLTWTSRGGLSCWLSLSALQQPILQDVKCSAWKVPTESGHTFCRDPYPAAEPVTV